MFWSSIDWNRSRRRRALGHATCQNPNPQVGEVVRGVGKVSLDVYNFLLKLDGKYDVSGKGGDALKTQLEKLKTGESGATVSKVEDTLSAATAKFDERAAARLLLASSRDVVRPVRSE